MAPVAAAGCLAAIWTASLRLAHSMMSKPPICSLVSANGPSDTSTSSSRTRTVAASLLGRSRAAAPDSPGVHFRVPGPDLRQGVHLGRAQDHRFVIADHQHVLHGPPSIVTIMQPVTAMQGIPRR